MFGSDVEMVCYACQICVKLQPVVYPHLFLNLTNLVQERSASGNASLQELISATLREISQTDMQYTASTFEQLLVMALAKGKLEKLLENEGNS